MNNKSDIPKMESVFNTEAVVDDTVDEGDNTTLKKVGVDYDTENLDFGSLGSAVRKFISNVSFAAKSLHFYSKKIGKNDLANKLEEFIKLGSQIRPMTMERPSAATQAPSNGPAPGDPNFEPYGWSANHPYRGYRSGD